MIIIVLNSHTKYIPLPSSINPCSQAFLHTPRILCSSYLPPNPKVIVPIVIICFVFG